MTKENSDATEGRQAGVIEATSAMIEAGAEALGLYYGQDGEPMDDLRRAAEAVFQAMMAARRASS